MSSSCSSSRLFWKSWVVVMLLRIDATRHITTSPNGVSVTAAVKMAMPHGVTAELRVDETGDWVDLTSADPDVRGRCSRETRNR